MFEWILIALVVAAIFYAGDLPKIRAFIEGKSKFLIEKAKEKKAEIEAKNKSEKNNIKDSADKK